MPIFCDKHRVIGSLAFRDGGEESLLTKAKETKKSKMLTDKKRKEIDLKISQRKEKMTLFLQGKGFNQINKIKEIVDNKFKTKSGPKRCGSRKSRANSVDR